MYATSLNILTPKGAEHQAVLKGIRKAKHHRASLQSSYSGDSKLFFPLELIRVVSLPMGPVPVKRYLESMEHRGDRIPTDSAVLLMGLGGSLVPALEIGAVTLLEQCIAGWLAEEHSLAEEHPGVMSDRSLIDYIQAKLERPAQLVRGVTTTQIISSVTEKSDLHQRFQASMVDMEGYSVLQFCQLQGLPGAVLRVVSDGCNENLPDVNAAISPEGYLRPLPLTLGLIRQPIATVRLIRGSIQGLRGLTQVAQFLASGVPNLVI